MHAAFILDKSLGYPELRYKHKKDSHSLGTLLSNMASMPNQLEFLAILQSVLATTLFVNTSNTSNMSNMHLNFAKNAKKEIENNKTMWLY